MKFNKNKYIGKQIQLVPSDAFEKYGIIEEVDDLGFWIKITQSKSKNYQEGEVHFFSHSRTMAFKILGWLYMGKPKTPDTPWHTTYLRMSSNDSRRHKSRCVYYKPQYLILNQILRKGFSFFNQRVLFGTSLKTVFFNQSTKKERVGHNPLNIHFSTKDFGQPNFY